MGTTLKRKVAGHAVALLAVLASAVSLQQGWIAVTDISAALAFTLIGTAGAALYWAWRPEITRWFAERNQPRLTIEPTKLKDDEKIKEIELIFRDGKMRRHDARFCYLTIRNTGSRSAEVSAWYNFHQQMIFIPLRSKPTFRANCRDDSEGFQGQIGTFGVEEAFAIALLNDERWTGRYHITVDPGPAGEAFVLFFTLKDFRVMTIPSGSRLYPNANQGFPCKLTISICVQGKDMPDYYVATFEVKAETWTDFKIKQIGQTKRDRVS
jgi:hypothetical protein